MEVVNVNRIQVKATPDELRKLADQLEKWWEKDSKTSPPSTTYKSIIGDNARVDFFIDAEKMKP